MLQDPSIGVRRTTFAAQATRPWASQIARQVGRRIWRQLARQVGLAVAVGVAYFLAAQLSLGLLTQPDGVAVFWPAAGVSAGVLIALGPTARLPVAAGAMAATIVANLMGDRTLAGARSEERRVGKAGTRERWPL